MMKRTKETRTTKKHANQKNHKKEYLVLFSLLLSLVLLFPLSAGIYAEEESGGTEHMEENPNSSFSVKSLGEELLKISGGLTFYSPYTETTYAVPSDVTARGIDVSLWQGKIDWQAVAGDGITFAFIRAAGRDHTTGEITTDPYFEANIQGAQAAGIKVGAYIFSQAIDTAEAQQEAQYVIDLVSNYGLELPIVMDYEFRDDKEGNHVGRLFDENLSKNEATGICLAFSEYIKARNYVPMIYANTEMLDKHLNAADMAAQTNIWFARYNTAQVYSIKGYTFPVWQYANTGSVNGISGHVDCNFAFIDLGVLGMPFDDVRQGAWYFDAVAYAYKHHLFNGMTPKTFEPETAMSRAMIVTVLHRLEQSPAADGNVPYADLTADWYKNSVAWAHQYGIVDGVTPTTFSPDTNVTREQLATLLYRYSEYKQYDLTASRSLSGFSDGTTVSDYAVAAVQWAIGNEYIRGYDDGTLRPQASATRAEVATILQRFRTNHQ